MSSAQKAIAMAHTLAQMLHHIQHGQHNRGKIDEAAESIGMQWLGSGNFSTAYAVPDSDYVVKVCFTDDAAITYLAWCRANADLPHVPRVHYLQKYKGGKFIAVLDKLEPMKERGNWGERDWRRYGVDFAEARGVLQDGEEPRTSVGHTALAIREFFKGVAQHDLHGENAMRDSNGTLVITDPLSFVNSHDMKTGIERAYGIKEAA